MIEKELQRVDKTAMKSLEQKDVLFLYPQSSKRNTSMFVLKKPRTESSITTVYKGNIIKNLIMDCQSYTKYRPNETTGGIFVSWRRKEELPTGA